MLGSSFAAGEGRSAAVAPNVPREARRQRGHRSHLSGAAAEDSVATHYGAAGLPIAARRWRGRSGEVDLITQDGDGLVFIEVKRARTFAAAAERITARQIQRIVNAACEYLAQMPLGQATPIRFDVALVNDMGQVRILEGAFTG
ncbi:MAG: YraN family protein [Pseudomonadota bacterium]